MQVKLRKDFLEENYKELKIKFDDLQNNYQDINKGNVHLYFLYYFGRFIIILKFLNDILIKFSLIRLKYLFVILKSIFCHN